MGKQHTPFSDEQIRKVYRMARYLTVEQIADVMEISSRTMRRRFNSDPRVLSAYKKGKGRLLGAVIRSLYKQALDGNVTAAIFIAKCQAGWRETDPRQVPIPDVQNMTDRELERESKRLGIVK